MSIRLRDGNVTVTLDDGLTSWAEDTLRATYGAVYDSLEREAQQVWLSAKLRAPRRSGRFERGLNYHIDLDLATDTIRATVSSEAPYTYWIRTPVADGYEYAWQELVAKPMRRSGRRLINTLASDLAAAVDGRRG